MDGCGLRVTGRELRVAGYRMNIRQPRRDDMIIAGGMIVLTKSPERVT